MIETGTTSRILVLLAPKSRELLSYFDHRRIRRHPRGWIDTLLICAHADRCQLHRTAHVVRRHRTLRESFSKSCSRLMEAARPAVLCLRCSILKVARVRSCAAPSGVFSSLRRDSNVSRDRSGYRVRCAVCGDYSCVSIRFGCSSASVCFVEEVGVHNSRCEGADRKAAAIAGPASKRSRRGRQQRN